MSVLISGALIDGAGIPMSGCHIILKSRVNTSEVVMRTVAHVVTGNNGEYSFDAQVGKYCVYLKQDWRDEYCVGDISVYDDSQPGTLNDFLAALDEGDLKPDVVKRFEEMVAQAQQSAEAAAGSAQETGQHLADVERGKSRVETLAEEVRKNTNAVAGDRQHVEQLAQEVSENAGQVQQGMQDAAGAVKAAQEAAKKSAASAGESKAGADRAAQSEQKAEQHAQTAEQHAQQSGLNLDATTTAKNEAEQSAVAARKDAEATAKDRTATAEDVKQSEQNAAESAQSAQDAKGYRDSAQQVVDGLNATNATTTQKGLVQLSSATDSDSEELAATPKAVKAVMDETKTKAPLLSPAFSGTPRTPTPPDDASGTEIANAAFVRLLIAALVDSVPESLDTLKELADALGNDPNFSTTVLNALAGKQPLNDILTSLSGLMTAGNKLAYFTDKNVMALANLTAVGRVLIGQNSKSDVLNYLGLKSAATMEPQSDIRDRTEGRLAIPGMFGFGKIFASSERVTFETEADFLRWVKWAKPGRYTVYGEDKVIPGTQFSGTVEIIWPEPQTNPIVQYVAKVIFFYGINGDIWYNRYWTAGNGYLIGWENLKVNETGLWNAINGKAPLNSPALTGTPTAPTPPDDAEGAEIATVEFVRKRTASATMEPQSDIYDRTDGRLALPGAFGYGAIFRTARSFSAANGPAEFLDWVKNTNPGQYAVLQYGGGGGREDPIIEGVVFTGIIDIKLSDAIASNASPNDEDKLVTFYGVNGEVYYNRLRVSSSGSSFIGWEKWLLTAKDIAGILRSSGGVANGYSYPGIGGIVFAAYCGKDDNDDTRKIWHGAGVAGSRLGGVSIQASYNPTGSHASTPVVVAIAPSLYPMAGTFVALSGSPMSSCGKARSQMGLFVRIA
ncbi:prophage tail fiber N-terminal domain-containing protein [Citrobacter freundii]|nr:prophage tail fiber N-terminal domain-containing protein [Citrobacter freundii]